MLLAGGLYSSVFPRYDFTVFSTRVAGLVIAIVEIARTRGMDSKTLLILFSVLVLTICVGVHGQNVSNVITSSTIRATIVTTSNASTTEHRNETSTTTRSTFESTGHSVISQTARKEQTTTKELQTTKELVTQTKATGPVTTAETAYTTGTEHNSTGKTTTIPCPSRKSFDTASFIGGIVLGLGVCIIAYFVYRWFRSKRQGPPYHQF